LGHRKCVVGGFASDKKDVIISHVDYTIRSCLEQTSQFVAQGLGQLVQKVGAEPVVAFRVVESDFKHRPKTIEKVGFVDVLLNE